MKCLAKKIFVMGMAAAVFMGIPEAEAAPEVPEDVYEWVQSTSRADYYFNKQQMYCGVDEDGYIDLNTLLVPVLKVYDSVQIEDVVAKRRWRMMDMEGYGDLVGASEYLEFKLAEKTVRVREHDDLDSTWSNLTVETGFEPVSLDSYGEKDVDGKFYKGILEYAAAHRDEIIARTKGELRPEDKKMLEEAQKASKDGGKKKKDKDKK